MPYCEKCGAKLDDGYAFCGACGTKRNDLSEQNEAPLEEEKKTKRKKKKICSETAYTESHTVGGSGSIMLCNDGKYRWVYEFSMLRNPTLYFTVLKVLTIGALCCTLPVILSSIGSEGLGALIEGAKVFGVVMVIFVPLSFLSYLILAGQYGWKYIVLFEMDENGVIHQQQDKQFDKATLSDNISGKCGFICEWDSLDPNRMDQMLQNSGAQRGDITISLMWDSYDDLDLHVIAPDGSEIYYNNPTACGGELDVDANANDERKADPVENIYFSEPISGEYWVYVYNYTDRTENSATNYLVRVTVGGESQTFSGTIANEADSVEILGFKYTS